MFQLYETTIMRLHISEIYQRKDIFPKREAWWWFSTVEKCGFSEYYNKVPCIECCIITFFLQVWTVDLFVCLSSSSFLRSLSPVATLWLPLPSLQANARRGCVTDGVRVNHLNAVKKIELFFKFFYLSCCCLGFNIKTKISKEATVKF